MAALLSLYQVDGSGTPSPVRTNKNLSRYCQKFSRGQNYPWLRTTALDVYGCTDNNVKGNFLFSIAVKQLQIPTLNTAIALGYITIGLQICQDIDPSAWIAWRGRTHRAVTYGHEPVIPKYYTNTIFVDAVS